MKVISVNRSEPVTIRWRGKEVRTGIFKNPVDEPLHLRPGGVDKDHVADLRVHGGIDKACYLYSADWYGYWKVLYPNLQWQPGMFGENLTVDGLDESEIRIGDVYETGEALIQVSQPRQPCFKLGVKFGTQKVLKQFINYRHPGVYARVIREGSVRPGDALKLTIRPDSLTIQEIFDLLYGFSRDTSQLEQALWDSNLSESVRKQLRRMVG